MPTPPIANFNLKHACARQFAARPTLRQVASQRILTLLVEQLPWLASVQPALTDAAPFMLDSPDPETAYWTTAPLVDVVLRSLLSGTKLDLDGCSQDLRLRNAVGSICQHSGPGHRSSHAQCAG
ncbi:hypothetical protein LOY46_25145 [Pseudomonas sichuanensis]|uniref:hypothetical protein n=1 Tax=Pseudomonas sichuanensis TaxID=2213015 RepID=UPI00215ECEE8|nr:hypothetical protein [Pseudomonas sichuanensis]UVK82778.1 hypothetical protein LOY46_25145 [Pseudomonas sichuanensis]